MTRNEVLEKLRGERTGLQRFAVRRLALFGSAARGEMGKDSDVDILVEFEPEARVGLLGFVRLQRYLSDLLNAPVDLVTRDALRPEFREKILSEMVYAA